MIEITASSAAELFWKLWEQSEKPEPEDVEWMTIEEVLEED